LIRGRGTGYIREASPLFDSPLVSLSLQGERGRDFREGQSPFFTDIPPSLNKGRGQGDGSPYKDLKEGEVAT
jgi:hypothetical protein